MMKGTQMVKPEDVVSPIPKPYGACPKCRRAKDKDCGEHSIDFAWRRTVAKLEADLPRLENERDYWKAKYENLAKKTGVTI